MAGRRFYILILKGEIPVRKTTSGSRAAAVKLSISLCLFGTIGVFVRYIPLPSSLIALVRGGVGMLFLLILLRIRRKRLNTAAIRENLSVLCVSGICLGINWIFFFEAFQYTTVATATLCYYLAPVFIILASPIVLQERLTTKKLLCVLVALVGMVFVSGVLESGFSGIQEMRGVLYGLGAAAFYACVVLLNKKLRGLSPFDTTIMQLGISAAVLLPYVLLTVRVSAEQLSPIGIAILLLVGVLHTGVAYTLYFGSIPKVSAQTVALFGYIDPIVAILLSALVLREHLSIYGILGAVMILGSTLVSELTEKSKRHK